MRCFFKVYNEEVRDLLSPGGKKLDLREEAGSTYIAGLKLIPITDADELFALLESGNRQRTQHPTDSNAESSRSHAVFQVIFFKKGNFFYGKSFMLFKIKLTKIN